MKCCTKCGLLKQEADFYKHKQCKNGINSYCKDCEKKGKRDYYSKNRSRIIDANKQYVKDNGGKVKSYKKNYASENSERLVKKSAFWAKNNIDRRNTNANNYVKRIISELKSQYLKIRLKDEGFTEKQISTSPELLQIKKAVLNIKRKIKQNANRNRNQTEKSIS